MKSLWGRQSCLQPAFSRLRKYLTRSQQPAKSRLQAESRAESLPQDQLLLGLEEVEQVEAADTFRCIVKRRFMVSAR